MMAAAVIAVFLVYAWTAVCLFATPCANRDIRNTTVINTNLICMPDGDETMSKEQRPNKEDKKKSELTLKEKRAIKKGKKEKGS